MKPAQPANRPREYAPHPLPAKAARYPHIGMFFAAHGPTDLAAEMSRNLLPDARAAVVERA